MNAKNNLQNPAFFIPDPWTETNFDGSFLSTKIYLAVSQAVNDNSKGEIKKSSYFWLLVAFLLKTRLSNWPMFIWLALTSRKYKWRKALFLDLFLSDLFCHFKKTKSPDFATLFLNGFAHVQHHYMFSSDYYEGNFENPAWYVPSNTDPLLDALQVYNRIFKLIFKQS